MTAYAVELMTRYDGLVIATFPDLPGLSALGRDDEEALDEARAGAGRACPAPVRRCPSRARGAAR